MIKTRKAAAKLLGVTERQLGNWTHEPWFPAKGRTSKGWNVDLIAQARDEVGLKGSDESERSRHLAQQIQEQKLEQAKVETDRKRLQLDKDRGIVIPRLAVELFASTLLTELADWCDQVPDIIASTVPTKLRKSLKKTVAEELDKRRTNLREQLEREAKLLDEQRETR